MRRNSERTDRPWIAPDTADVEGFLGMGGDLSPQTLLLAYADGVFPWFNEEDPILWWSPDPRAVIELNDLHISRSLAKTLRQGQFRITLNTQFERVMRACGDRRPEGTWVTESMVQAYCQLHRMGYAHSLETWQGDQLAGGIYGIALGAFFSGESMFHTVTDGSKVALVMLVQRLRASGFELFDVQMTTPHTMRMGARDIPRADYLRRLRAATAKTAVQLKATD